MIFNKVIFLGSFQFFLEVYLIFNLLVSRYEKKKFYIPDIEKAYKALNYCK